jgi:hypothetical protein
MRVGKVCMLRSAKTFLMMLALFPFASLAMANDFVCRWNCFTGDFYPRVHNFHPRWRDGMPLVNDFQYDPEGYHGVGCVSSWRPVATPNGLVWSLFPLCLEY